MSEPPPPISQRVVGMKRKASSSTANKPARVWMTIKRTAEHTGLSTRTIWRLISAGLLKAYQPQGRVLLDMLEVDEAITKHPVRPDARHRSDRRSSA